MMGTDVSAIEKPHAKLHATLLHQGQQTLPDPQPRLADEGLGRHPQGPQIQMHGAPLGPVLVPPDVRPDRESQMLRRHPLGGLFVYLLTLAPRHPIKGKRDICGFERKRARAISIGSTDKVAGLVIEYTVNA